MTSSGQLLGLNLRKYREAQHLTQAELAEKCDMSTNMIQKLEHGRTNPSIKTIDRLCMTLKVRPADLYADSSAPDPSGNGETFLESSLNEVAKLLSALGSVHPARRCAALYLLTKDENYLTRLSTLPGAAPIAQALKKLS